MNQFTILVLSLFSLTSSSLLAQSGKCESDQILGYWFTGEKKAKIEIFKYGDKYYGKIVWLKDPLNVFKPKAHII